MWDLDKYQRLEIRRSLARERLCRAAPPEAAQAQARRAMSQKEGKRHARLLGALRVRLERWRHELELPPGVMGADPLGDCGTPDTAPC